MGEQQKKLSLIIDKSKLSPMMQQYVDTKDNYPDCLLFYRLGDFYELFFEDAKIASKTLDIALTGRNCGMEEKAPMCRPAAFTGYELMLLAAMFLTSAAAVMLLTRRQHVQAIGCMTAAAVNLLARWVLTRTALPAWGVSTLLTAALSLLLLTAAACAYTAAGASSSQRSSTAS